jgi:integrase
MSRPALKSLQIHEGKINLHKRNTSPIWHCAFTLNNTLLRSSTKTANLDEAKEIAFDKYMTARIKLKEGIPFAPRAFNSLAERVIANLKKDLADEPKVNYTSSTEVSIAFLNNYAIPFFTNTPIQSINKHKLAEFDAYRVEQMGKVPTRKTVNCHNFALKLVFEYAVDHNYITKSDIPTFENTGNKSEPRKEFTSTDYEKMQKYIVTDWLENETKDSQRYNKKLLLKDYISFIYEVGCRPGTETKGLKFSHMRFFTGKDGVEYLGITVDGKTGRRETIPQHAVYGCLQNIVNRRETFKQLKGEKTKRITLQEVVDMKSDEFVFAYPNGEEATELNRLFNDLLIALNMRTDAITKENKTLYCLRHSYATNRLLEGMDIYMLAKNMGNSPEMIKTHYDHAISAAQAHLLAGEEK